jgi:hypothetical protein
LSTIDKILGFVDRPWKIAAVVILAATGIAGLALYEHRSELAEAVLSGWVSPRLEAGRFTKLGRQLLDETGADVVVLASLSVRSNLIKNVDGIKRGDPGWEPQKNPRPLFADLRDPVAVVDLIEGKVTCRDIVGDDGTEERELARLGLKRRCYIAVPPVLDALVGGLEIAWHQGLSPEAEAGAQRLLYQTATQLATW